MQRLTDEQLAKARSWPERENIPGEDWISGADLIRALVDEVRERRASDLTKETWAVLGDALDGIEPASQAEHDAASERLAMLAKIAGLKP